MHIDVRTNEFTLFHRAMQTVYRLSRAHSADANTGVADFASRTTRPASTISHDRLKRSISIRQACSNKLARAGAVSKSGPPRVKRSLSQSSSVSSRSSVPSTFPPSIGDGRSVRHPSDAGPIEPHVNSLTPPLSDGGGESPISNTPVSTVEQGDRAFDSKLREAVWLLAGEF